MRCCEHRRDARSGIWKAGWRGRARDAEMTMLSVIGARVIRHGRTGDRSHTGLIRHVTSDTRSLITRAQLTPSDFRHKRYVMYVGTRKKASNWFKEYQDKGNLSWDPSHLHFLIFSESEPFPDFSVRLLSSANKWWYPVIDMFPTLIDNIIMMPPCRLPASRHKSHQITSYAFYVYILNGSSNCFQYCFN